MTNRFVAWVEYHCPVISAAAQAAAFGYVTGMQL